MKNDEKNDLENSQNKGKSEKSDGYVKMKRMTGDRGRWRKWVAETCPRAEDQ